MARSLGFAAYRALSRRKSRPSPAVSRPRPDGDMLWLHATTADRIPTLCELGIRVRSMRNDLGVLVTWEQDENNPDPISPELAASGIQLEQLASDHPSEATHLLDHWKPDMCLWAGSALMPNLINEAADRAIPLIMVDVNREDSPARRPKWFPDLIRSSIAHFQIIMTNSQAAADMLRRLGVPGNKITVSEPLRNGPSPPPFPENDLTATSLLLAGRPLWLAAHAQVDEFEPILTAHRVALKLVHRLLLVLNVADPNTLDQLAESLQSTGLRFARWQIGDDIDDNTQVLIFNEEEDLGLWYRMAPLTFMASSLTIGNTGRNPLEAVALGSAILFGPHVLGHRAIYSRLTSVGAGRAVGDANGLGTVVIRLVAPDHAAAMALAGWEVVTEGAELTDRLVELVHETLDTQGPSDARA